MFFGKFLLDKKVITQEQLIEAVALQTEKQPSILRLLQNDKAVTTEQLVEVISESYQVGKSIQGLLLEKNYLSAVKLQELSTQNAHAGISLGQAFVQLNILPAEELNEHLQAYLVAKKNMPELEKLEGIVDEESKADVEIKTDNEKAADVEISSAALDSLKELGITDESEMAALEEQSTQSAAATPVQAESSQESAEVEISSAALDSLKELGITDESEMAALEKQSAQAAGATPAHTESSQESGEVEISSAALDSLKELGITDESELAALEQKQEKPGLEFEGIDQTFLEALNENFYEKMNESAKKLAKGLDDQVISELYHNISKLADFAVKEEFKYAEKLLTCYKKVIEYAMDKQTNFLNFNFLTFASTTKEALSLVWDLKKEIEKTGNEVGLLSDSEWKNRYVDNLKSGVGLISIKEGA